MSNMNTSNLITPPKETEEIYPYRRVWRSIIIEAAALCGFTGLVVFLYSFTSFRIPATIEPFANIIFVLLPAILWLIFSRWRESFAQEPRRRLLSVFLVTALIANAIGIPLLDRVIQPESWLSDQSALNRIIGYMLTVGVMTELLKYLVLRYLVWPAYYRNRLDAAAYGAASAIGYATTINLIYALENPATSADFMLLHVLNVYAMNLIGSLIVSYGFSETKFQRVVPLFLPLMFVGATFIHGIATALQPSFMAAPIGFTPTSARPLFGYVFSIVLIVAFLSLIIFTYGIALRRERAQLIGSAS